jgi:hypothetical protein
MTWKLTGYDFPFAIGDGLMRRKPGEYWRIPFDYRPKMDKEQRTYLEIWQSYMSPEYLSLGWDFELVICLPGKIHFRASHIEMHGLIGEGAVNFAGWEVTGELPNIDVEGYYHGWIENGVIGDDLNGRRYAEDGSLRREGVSNNSFARNRG